MKKLILPTILALAAVILVVAIFMLPKKTAFERKNVDFTIVSRGDFSFAKDAGNTVIRTKEALRNTWDTIYPPGASSPQLPDTDFSSNYYIAVFMGEKPTSGYSVDITSIQEDENGYEVLIESISPPNDGATAQVMTQPYVLARIPATEKNITFTVEKKEESN